MNLPISSVFSFIVINVKVLLNFEKEWCTFDKKNKMKNKTIVIVILNMQKDS
jgi:hypothetical protein